MKPSRISIALIVVSLVLAPAVFAQAPAFESQSAASPAPAVSGPEVPRLIKFSGTLLDEQGHALAGPVGVTFALYAQQTGGAALWIETQNVKPDASGNYTALLGANSAKGVPAELFTSNEARWLGIQLGQQPEHERILLVSVPYALKAGDAETLGGRPLSSFVLNEASATGGSAGSAAAATSSAAGNTQPTPGASVKTSATPQAATPCSTVTSDGTAAANSISLFTTACNIEGSLMSQATINGFPGIKLAGNNAGLLLNGTGTHQVTVTGATSGRLGQDANGFFFASDTNGKSVRFLTNSGTLNEWMRITSAGNVGIGTTMPAATLDVVSAATSGNVFRVAGPTGGLVVQSNGVVTASGGVNASGLTVNGNAIVSGPADGSDAMDVSTPGLLGFQTSAISASNTDSNVGDGSFAVNATAVGGIGVNGTSTSGVGVKGITGGSSTIAFASGNGGAGVWGDTNVTNGVAVVGTVKQGTGVWAINASTNTTTPALQATSLTNELVFRAAGTSASCTIDGSANLVCSGSKSAVVPVNAGQKMVALYAVEAPENWFEDYGSGQLASGAATVTLDATYAQTVNTDMQYHVFLTPNGDCKGLYVSRKSPTSFEVHELGGGTSNIAFDYRIIAKRRGYEQIRLADKTEMMKAAAADAARLRANFGTKPPPAASHPLTPGRVAKQFPVASDRPPQEIPSALATQSVNP